jgi:hypothetical protein
MMTLVWAVLDAALSTLGHRGGIHRRRRPWRAAAAVPVAWWRSVRHTGRHHAAEPQPATRARRAPRRPSARAQKAAAWSWWQERRKDYEPALRAAGAW